MAETVSAVVGEILAQGSFDLSPAEALAILNRRHKQMCARSRCVRSATSATRIGAAGASATYAAPAGLMDMMQMAGVFATALQRPGEARPDLAAQQEQVFSAACEELRARVARRNRGGGPAQIRLSGLLAS
jgi:hypothetical protein